METIETLARLRARHPSPPPAGSPAEAEALARFARFFSSFAPDRVATLLPDTYAEDVYFNDTLKAMEGRAALAHYLRDSAEAVESCRVEILETTRTAHDEHLVRWTMMIRFKKFRRGVDTWTVGMSHLRFDADGRVVYHQDYWNAAEGLFQHIPVIGTLINAVKRRL
ncbi:MAG TPA: nuclear transport factor 2 family protein [Arenimonas sp.]|uniref:nuclear transport factor 2 family protein n=1 Tax=Arenimonas sp. TaxID=1872635 RepID=UPI002D806C69|nr:nuclear transport factor 2 family protein [Arenimonas sp.]HEU0152943.1 nuclear transport factor 2 family protein [Arenimonas sp.]